MEESIGKTLAEELKKRAGAQARLDAEASEKSSQQKASDEAALSSLVSRVGEEIENFNQNAEGLPRITLTRADEAGPYTLMSVREVTFLIHASRLQITLPPSNSPVFSTVRQDAKGYIYHHIGPNGMATNRESTEDEIVDGLLKQACGL